MSGFTPAPWTFFLDSGGFEASIWSGDAYKIHVADVGPSEKTMAEVDANARLIAAAPELLEALRLADALLSGSNMNAGVVEKKVRAALAKATGNE